jgi:hypothetical protein
MDPRDEVFDLLWFSIWEDHNYTLSVRDIFFAVLHKTAK